MFYVGIDPGKKGGIAVIDEYGAVHETLPMPNIFYLNESLLNLSAIAPISHVLLEKAQAMPKQGVCSMFNYGEHYGMIQGVVVSQKLRFTLIKPQEWQKEMLKGTTSTTDTKSRALEAVKRLFPKLNLFATPRCRKPHDGMIDSVLLAEFCRRKLL